MNPMELLWAMEAMALARMTAAAAMPYAGTIGRNAEAQTQIVGSTAIIGIHGVITRSASIFGQLFGGETTQQSIRAALASALADSRVDRFMLSVDSPGGLAMGLSDVAEAVRDADKRKPVYTHTQGMMASAAYLIGSQARRVYASPDAFVGSIGTVAVVYDFSRLLENAGIHTNVISSGPLKGTGIPGSALTEAQRADIQRSVDDYTASFRQAVIRGRKLPAQRVEELADGRMHIGTEAQRLGLVDQVASFEQALQAVAGVQSSGGVRIVSGGAPPVPTQEKTMTFEQWLTARGLAADKLSAEERTKLEQEYKQAAATAPPVAVNPTPPAAGANPVAQETATLTLLSTAAPDANAVRQAADAAIAAERARVSGIRAAAVGIEDVTGVREALAQAESEGWTIDRTRTRLLECVRDSRRNPASVAIHGTRQDVGDAVAPWSVHYRPLTRAQAAVSAGIMLRAGFDPVVTPAAGAARGSAAAGVRAEQERAANEGERYARMSLLEMCAESLRASGRPIPSDRDEMIRAATSSSDGANIFTTSVNVMLLSRYEAYPDTTLGWVREETVSNFLIRDAIQLAKTGALTKLARGGTAEHVHRGDSKETYRPARYAQMFEVDDQDIIDDRFNAIQQMPIEMGEASAQLRPDLIYYILLSNPTLATDSVALFNSAHGNTQTGAFAAATVQALIAAMGKQTQNGRNLNLDIGYLIVPQDLRFAAEILLTSSQRIISTSDGGTANPLASLGIQLRVDNRIGVAGVTDPDSGTAQAGTATNYFAAARGRQEVVCAYVGNRNPTVRSYTLDKGRYGIGWDIKLDIGAKALGYRGLQFSTGA